MTRKANALRLAIRIFLPILTFITMLVWWSISDFGEPLIGTLVAWFFVLLVVQGSKHDRFTVAAIILLSIIGIVSIFILISKGATVFPWVAQILWLGTIIFSTIWMNRTGKVYVPPPVRRNIWGHKLKWWQTDGMGTSPAGWYTLTIGGEAAQKPTYWNGSDWEWERKPTESDVQESS